MVPETPEFRDALAASSATAGTNAAMPAAQYQRPAMPDFMQPDYAPQTVSRDRVSNFVDQLTHMHANAIADRDKQIRDSKERDTRHAKSWEQLEVNLAELHSKISILDSDNYDLRTTDQQHRDLLAKLEREKLASQANELQLYQTINQYNTLLKETKASHAGMQQGLQEQLDEQYQQQSSYIEREREIKRRHAADTKEQADC